MCVCQVQVMMFYKAENLVQHQNSVLAVRLRKRVDVDMCRGAGRTAIGPLPRTCENHCCDYDKIRHAVGRGASLKLGSGAVGVGPSAAPALHRRCSVPMLCCYHTKKEGRRELIKNGYKD